MIEDGQLHPAHVLGVLPSLLDSIPQDMDVTNCHTNASQKPVAQRSQRREDAACKQPCQFQAMQHRGAWLQGNTKPNSGMKSSGRSNSAAEKKTYFLHQLPGPDPSRRNALS